MLFCNGLLCFEEKLTYDLDCCVGSVACRQLGFQDAVSSYLQSGATYLHRVGLDNITCLGEEKSLLNCQHGSYFPSSDDHLQDVFTLCLCKYCNDHGSYFSIYKLINKLLVFLCNWANIVENFNLAFCKPKTTKQFDAVNHAIHYHDAT